MLLENCGIRVEATHPAEIARLKSAGYKPVEKPVKPAAEAEAPVTEEKEAAPQTGRKKVGDK